jgi:hypothetical protein
MEQVGQAVMEARAYHHLLLVQPLEEQVVVVVAVQQHLEQQPMEALMQV